MAAPQSSNQSEGSAGLLWVVVFVFAVIGIIWVTCKTYIVTCFFKLKLLEIALASYFTNNLDDVRSAIVGALSSDVTQLKLSEIGLVGQAVGDYVRYPSIALIVILAVLVYFSNSVRHFKRFYSMRGLVEAEQTNWPQVSPVVKLNLVKADIDKGPWAMAMTPMQFCKRYGLLEEYRRQMQEGMSRKEANRIDVNLKRGRANKLFTMQLGPLWGGTNRLPPYVKALFAVFAARINNDSKTALELLRQLSGSATKKLDYSGVDKLCKKHESSKLVQKIIESHAYVLTVMAAMLEGARSDGVQASADFLWLKPIDRRLWYMLNTVGRQTPFVEVAGPFAHWIAEKEMGKKIIVPMVEEATNALGLALKDVIYRPDAE
jgi:intracellular multiplication protein IcmP